MRVAAFFWKRNVRGQRNVPGDSLPRELEGVGREPHVFTAALKRVGLMCGVVLRRAGVHHGAEVSVILKETEGCWGALRR